MVGKTFSLFHISLLPIEQLSFESRAMTREDWLRFVFSEPFDVEYRAGDNIYWVPHHQDEQTEMVMGVVQKERLHSLHEPPHEGGGEITAREWQGAYIVLDPTHHEMGQRIAVENDVVGKPNSLLSAIFDHINARHDRPYNIEFDAIFDGDSFWSFANRHDQRLKWVKFEFTAPNMWGTKTELDRELMDTRDQTGAEKVKIELRGRSGVKTDSQKVRDGVEYAERGAGVITARSMDDEQFSSQKKQKKTSVLPPLGEEESKDGFLAKMAKKILGRNSEDVHSQKAGAVGDSGGDGSDSSFG